MEAVYEGERTASTNKSNKLSRETRELIKKYKNILIRTIRIEIEVAELTILFSNKRVNDSSK